MRLTEEKDLMKLNVNSLIFIVLTSVFIQISDHYLGQRTDDATIRILTMLQKEQFKVNHDIKARFYTIYRALNIEAQNTKTESEPEDTSYVDKERIELRRQFKAGAISSQEYTEKLIDLHHSRSEKYRREYNKIWNDIQKTKPTKWGLVKKMSFLVQIIGICVLVFGYSKLHLLIEKRSAAGNPKRKNP